MPAPSYLPESHHAVYDLGARSRIDLVNIDAPVPRELREIRGMIRALLSGRSGSDPVIDATHEIAFIMGQHDAALEAYARTDGAASVEEWRRDIESYHRFAEQVFADRATNDSATQNATIIVPAPKKMPLWGAMVTPAGEGNQKTATAKLRQFAKNNSFQSPWGSMLMQALGGKEAVEGILNKQGAAPITAAQPEKKTEKPAEAQKEGVEKQPKVESKPVKEAKAGKTEVPEKIAA